MLLEVKDLSLKLGSKSILRNVSLEIDKGEVHVLFGPNGAGKSTLLKAIMGIPPYDKVEGKIVFDGKDITKLKPYERALLGISLSYQHPPPINVKLAYLLKKVREKYGSSNEMVESIIPSYLLGRDAFLTFSGGESKRVEMGISLLQSPKLALLDEPDSGVDVDSIKVIAHSIDMLREKGAAILLVTHLGYVTGYLRKIDRAHVIIRGSIVASDEFEEIYRRVIREGYSSFLRGW